MNTTGLHAPDWSLGFPELAFAAPVCGPLAFGFGAHFGLGLFVPADAV
jgi:CRISPR-associated protein Csb2